MAKLAGIDRAHAVLKAAALFVVVRRVGPNTMENHEVSETLERILRRELAECEQAMRAQDPVRALNDLADAVKAIKSLLRDLDARQP